MPFAHLCGIWWISAEEVYVLSHWEHTSSSPEGQQIQAVYHMSHFINHMNASRINPVPKNCPSFFWTMIIPDENERRKLKPDSTSPTNRGSVRTTFLPPPYISSPPNYQVILSPSDTEDEGYHGRHHRRNKRRRTRPERFRRACKLVLFICVICMINTLLVLYWMSKTMHRLVSWFFTTDEFNFAYARYRNKAIMTWT